MNDIPQLGPNQTPWPSAEWNNPEFAAYLGLAPNEKLELTVPEETALGSPIGDVRYMPQGPSPSMAAMRLQFPNLEVVPWPAKVVSLQLVANVAQDITLPDGTVAIILRGNGDYYVSNAGAAAIPVPITNSNNDSTNQSMYKPEGYVMYVGNLRQLSFIAASGVIVSLSCYPLTPINP